MTPKIARTLYALGTIVTGVLSVALIWGGIEQGTADSIGQIITGLTVLIGGTAVTGTAGVRVTRQAKDGILGTPADRVIAGVEAITATRDQAAADLDRITGVVADQLAAVPVVGPLTKQILDSVTVR